MLGGMELLKNKIMVTNYGENSISLIDKEDLSSIDTIDLKNIVPGMTGTTRVIFEGDHNLLVLNSDNDSLYRVDIDKLKLLNQVNLGCCPIRMKTYRDKIYVINIDSNSLSIIDREDFTVIENIYIGEKPTDLAIDEDSGRVYITNLNSYSVSVIDYEDDKIDEIRLKIMPFRIKVDKIGIYILGFLNNNSLNYGVLSYLDKANHQFKWTKVIGGIYFDFFKNKDRESFYLVGSEDSWLYELNADSDTYSKKLYIGGLTNFINYDSQYLYLNDMVNNQIILVDVNNNKIKKRIAVGKEPHDILLT